MNMLRSSRISTSNQSNMASEYCEPNCLTDTLEAKLRMTLIYIIIYIEKIDSLFVNYRHVGSLKQRYAKMIVSSKYQVSKSQLQ